jgi:hypothetical protein
MNYSTAIFLINDSTRLMKCEYDPDKPHNTQYFKTLDQTIEEGDFVIVQSSTRHEMTVVKVVGEDEDVDFDSNTRIDWIIGRIDLQDFKDLKRQEQEAIDAIKKAEKRRKRDELRAALFKDHEESIKELDLAKAGSTLPAPDAPPPPPPPQPDYGDDF